MRDKNKQTRASGNPLEFLGVRRSVPQALLQQRIAAVKRGIMGGSKENYAIKSQYAKYSSQFQEKSKAGSERQIAQATNGILEIHKKLAKRKLAAPTVASELSGIVTGRIGGRVTPPFDYAFTLTDDPAWSYPNSGNPTLVGSANKETGQISNSAVTDYQASSNGNVYSEMGIYFHPPWGPANLTLSASPSISFEWWVNSLGQSAVYSGGGVRLGIYAAQGTSASPLGPAEAWSWIDPWDVFPSGELRFEWGSSPSAFVSTQLNGLDPSFECVLYVAAINQVQGIGWPGSLAGSMISVTVPSITFELDAIQVLNR